jgi:hypothetical protein
MAVNLKPFVNDPTSYRLFQEYVKEQIEKYQSVLLNSEDMKDVYRTQGKIRLLSEFQKLRDKVNDGRSEFSYKEGISQRS